MGVPPIDYTFPLFLFDCADDTFYSSFFNVCISDLEALVLSFEDTLTDPPEFYFLSIFRLFSALVLLIVPRD